MIAFKASYYNGDLKIDANEIEDTAWFNLDNLSELRKRQIKSIL